MAQETVELQFTNNFHVWLRSLLLSNRVANGTTYTTNTGLAESIVTLGNMTTIDDIEVTSIPIKYSGGGDYYPSYGLNVIPFSAFNSNNADNYSSHSFIFGTGQKSFDATDTALQTPITSGISVSIGALHCEEDNIGCLDYAVTITNTGAENITIYEIGLSKNAPSSTINHNITTHHILMARGVLSEGLTVKARQSRSITIRLSMPLA